MSVNLWHVKPLATSLCSVAVHPRWLICQGLYSLKFFWKTRCWGKKYFWPSSWKVWEFHDGQQIRSRREIWGKKQQQLGGQMIADKREMWNLFNLNLSQASVRSVCGLLHVAIFTVLYKWHNTLSCSFHHPFAFSWTVIGDLVWENGL